MRQMDNSTNDDRLIRYYQVVADTDVKLKLLNDVCDRLQANFGKRVNTALVDFAGLLLSKCLGESADPTAAMEQINRYLKMSARMRQRIPLQLVQMEGPDVDRVRPDILTGTSKK
jgi:hypothetical protein